VGRLGGGLEGMIARGVGTASEPSICASNLPVTKRVLLARGAFARSTPWVCALRGLLSVKVFPDGST